MKLLRLVPVIVLIAASSSARADKINVGFMADFVTGVSVPIHDGDYKDFSDASFKMGIRLGAVFNIGNKFGIAPEGEFDFIPVNSSDDRFQRNSLDAQFYRERGIFGARFIVPFNIGSFYVRAMVGVDHIGGSVTFSAFGVRVTNDFSSTGFTLEPGAGVQFNIVKHLVVGFSTGFPVAWHDFGRSTPARSQSFTAVDIDFLGVVGVRL